MKLTERMLRTIWQYQGKHHLAFGCFKQGSASQVSAVLRQRQADEILFRIGVGVYAKTRTSTVTRATIPAGSLETLAEKSSSCSASRSQRDARRAIKLWGNNADARSSRGTGRPSVEKIGGWPRSKAREPRRNYIVERLQLSRRSHFPFAGAVTSPVRLNLDPIGVYMPKHPMPSDFQSSYEAIRTEVTWLHGYWKIYSQLFSKTEKRIELLNECATTFFFVVHQTLLKDLLLTLCKLTDPAKQGKNENLSLWRLQDQLAQVADSAVASAGNATLLKIEAYVVPLRDLRNKQLAHLDLETALEKNTNRLSLVQKRDIDKSLQLIRTYLNSIQLYFNDSEWGYEHLGMIGTDGDALVHVLRDGLRYGQLLSDEALPYDDFLRNPWNDV